MAISKEISEISVIVRFFIPSMQKEPWVYVNLFGPPHPVNPAFKQPDSVADLRVVLG